MRAPLALVCLLLGCSSEDAATEPVPEPQPAEFFGTISLNLREANEASAAYSQVSGTVYDGPSPLDFGLETVLEQGECQLREPTHPFCDPPCGSEAMCIRDGECMPYPKAQDAGELSVAGLFEEVTLPAVPPNFRYQSAELAYPPCDEGSALQLGAASFQAEAPCIAPLVIDDSEPVRVRSDEPVVLTWQASELVVARIQIFLDISHHGGKKGDIVCDVPDTGHYEIPASLVTPLVDLGLAGYPSVILTRWTGGVSSPPDVRFKIAASAERPVDTGVRSCVPNSAENCPDGQTCDPMSNICG
jgi:hypothetical protein